MYRVVGTIDIQIQPEAKEVLVMRRDNIRSHEMARLKAWTMGGGFGFAHSLGEHDSAEGGIGFQHAILVKDPVKRVIVIADCGDKENDQLAGASRFVLFRITLVVFPQHPAV